MKFIFEVRIKPGCTEEQYTEAWQRGSAIIQKEPGAMGTNLHRKVGEQGVLLAIATWETKEARDAAMEKLKHVDPEARAILDKHKEFGDVSVVGNFDEPEWVVGP
jgi:antibiotic biosynthesis monooxygenase (ABM) superfamily enzyme